MPEAQHSEYFASQDDGSPTDDLHLAFYLDESNDALSRDDSFRLKQSIMSVFKTVCGQNIEVRSSSFVEVGSEMDLQDLSLVEVIVTSVISTTTAELLKTLIKGIRECITAAVNKPTATIIVDNKQTQLSSISTDTDIEEKVSRLLHDKKK